jgi:hypothetical protein
MIAKDFFYAESFSAYEMQSFTGSRAFPQEIPMGGIYIACAVDSPVPGMCHFRVHRVCPDPVVCAGRPWGNSPRAKAMLKEGQSGRVK